MKNVKRLWGWILSLTFVLALIPVPAVTVRAASTEWATSDSLPTEAGEYKLTTDVTLADTWTVPSGETTLDLNGYGILMTGSGNVIRIESSGNNLTLKDSNESAVHYITLNGYRGTVVSTSGSESAIDGSGNGTIKVIGGYITGGTGNKNAGSFERGNLLGGGILVSDGTLTMEGGSIIGNTAYCGGGVYVVADGTFNLSKGFVTYNKASNQGGGVQAGEELNNTFSQGSFTMTGGSIAENVADGSHGGGVFVVGEGSTFNLSDGEIFGNTARFGSGVSIYKNSTFEMSDGRIVNNNASMDGGGVYNYGGSFTMSGGTIMRNTATRFGGGVCSPVNISGKVNITGNKAGGEASNVFGSMLAVNSTLDAASRIGVTYSLNKTFTSGLGTTGGITDEDTIQTIFIPDNSSYVVIKTDDAEAMLTDTIPVTLDAKGGVGGTESVSATPDAAMPEATMPTKEHYIFDGYYTEENGGGTQYYKADGSSAKNWDIKKTTTLYASWKAEDAASVTTAPTAKTDLTYTGKAQELVTAGEATGGTLQYALGTDATTEPTDGWSTSIPTATNAGTYYVWYRVVSDESDGDNHTDFAGESITVTIERLTLNASDVTVTFPSDSYGYTGGEVTPVPTVTVKVSGVPLSESEFAVVYSNNTEIGTATATVVTKDGASVVFGTGESAPTATFAIIQLGKKDISTEVKRDETSPEVVTSNLTEEFAEATLSAEEKAKVDDAIEQGKGVDINVYLSIKDINESISDADKEQIAASVADADFIEYFDISLVKEILIGGEPQGATVLHDLSTPLSLTVAVPQSFPAVEDGYTRAYVVLRLHDGNVDILPATVNADGTITFTTDKFSTYALAYTDTLTTTPTTPTATSATPAETTETMKPAMPTTPENTTVYTNTGNTAVMENTSNSATETQKTAENLTSPKTDGIGHIMKLYVILMLAISGFGATIALKKR